MGLSAKLNLRQKLVLILSSASALSILIALCAVHTYTHFEYRDDMAKDLLAEARFVGFNSTAAIEFDVAEEAEIGLRALVAHPNIVGATILDPHGEPFAAYRRPDAPDGLFAPLPLQPGHHYLEGRIYASASIPLSTGDPAAVYLVSDMEKLRARAKRNVLIGFGVFVVIALLAVAVSIPVQRIISGPILRLAHTARTVTEQEDYSVRAGIESADELGTLSAQFNHMLDEIQRRDRRLRESNDQLEERVRDRTRALREARDEALAASRAKGDFLANMSHELRTPLNGISGMMELLSRTELTNEQRERISVVSESAAALVAIVNDILDFSKIEAGKFDLILEPFDLHDLLHGLCELMSVSASEKSLQLIAHYHHACPRRLVGDGPRIRQILTNLVGNAIKFTSEGRILVRIECASQSEESAMMQFSIEDTGIGIDTEKLDSVFETFTQADASMTRKYGGTGLGLAICRRLIELMGGTVAIESAPGRGTVVRFALPLAIEHSPTVTPDTPPSPRAHILLLDSDPESRMAYADNLGHWGFSTRAMVAIAEGISFIETCTEDDTLPDVVLVNLAAPTVNPDEVTALLDCAAERSTPVIGIGSRSAKAFAAQGPSSRFSRVVHGFVTPSRLLDAIATELPGAMGAPRNSASPALSTAPSQGQGGKRVLLVEDNAVNVMVAHGFLSQLDMEVTVANNGQEAVELVQQQAFDIVLMDVQMPVMDGLSATRAIRTNERGQRIPIVAMTANAMSGDRERCLDAGMDDYLAKPLSGDALREMLEQFLGEVSQSSSTGQEFIVVAATETRANTIASAIQSHWSNAGVFTTANVAEALIRIGATLPDCVLLDTNVTGMDWSQLLDVVSHEERYHTCRIARWASGPQPEGDQSPIPLVHDVRSLEQVLAGAAPGEDLADSSPTADTPKLFDRELALTYAGGVEDRLTKLIQLALKELPAQIKTLDDAIQNGDQKTATRCAHSIKSEAAYLGSTQLRDIATNAERSARDGALHETTKLLPRLVALVDGVCECLRRELDNKETSAS